MMKYLLMLLISSILAIGLAGCNEDPFEDAGEQVDETYEDAGDILKDAGNAVEDGCENVTGENC